MLRCILDWLLQRESAVIFCLLVFGELFKWGNVAMFNDGQLRLPSDLAPSALVGNWAAHAHPWQQIRTHMYTFALVEVLIQIQIQALLVQ